MLSVVVCCLWANIVEKMYISYQKCKSLSVQTWIFNTAALKPDIF